MDGAPDAGISGTTADVARHGSINVGIARIRVAAQKGCSTHDLASLTVTALGYVFVYPGLLNGVQYTAIGKTFNGSDSLVGQVTYRNLAGSHRSTIKVNSAGSTLGNTATVFGPYQAQLVAKYPKERGRGVKIPDVHCLTVNL
jgi:hypothetical protein